MTEKGARTPRVITLGGMNRKYLREQRTISMHGCWRTDDISETLSGTLDKTIAAEKALT